MYLCVHPSIPVEAVACKFPAWANSWTHFELSIGQKARSAHLEATSCEKALREDRSCRSLPLVHAVVSSRSQRADSANLLSSGGVGEIQDRPFRSFLHYRRYSVEHRSASARNCQEKKEGRKETKAAKVAPP